MAHARTENQNQVPSVGVCVAIPPEATFSLPLPLRLPFDFYLRAYRVSRISAEREGRGQRRFDQDRRDVKRHWQMGRNTFHS